MNVIKPDTETPNGTVGMKPERFKEVTPRDITIFLAGSIEMGSAPEWQTEFVQKFTEFDVTFYNPRRGSWDSSWEQTQTQPQFNHQVNWELNKLDECTFIFMHFSEETKSPISLLELGYYARSGKIIVSCPKKFWRVGNVEVMCTRNSIPLFYNIDEAAGALQTLIRKAQA